MKLQGELPQLVASYDMLEKAVVLFYNSENAGGMNSAEQCNLIFGIPLVLNYYAVMLRCRQYRYDIM